MTLRVSSGRPVRLRGFDAGLTWAHVHFADAQDGRIRIRRTHGNRAPDGRDFVPQRTGSRRSARSALRCAGPPHVDDALHRATRAANPRRRRKDAAPMESQLDCQGTDHSTPLSVTLDEAHDALHLASLLVHWFDTGRSESDATRCDRPPVFEAGESSQAGWRWWCASRRRCSRGVHRRPRARPSRRARPHAVGRPV